MKKFLFSAVLVTLSVFSYAQTTGNEEKTIVERITKLEKKTDAFNVYINSRMAFNGYLNRREEAVGFKIEDLRINIGGNIGKNVYYQYRQSLNRGTDGSGNVDNLNASINIAGVGVRACDKFSIFVGRQFVAYGGYEFDYAPMDVYEYSEFINNITSFLTGIDFSYKPIKNQEIRFQVTNTYSKKYEDYFGSVPSHIKKAIVPLQYTINWNSTMFNGHYSTRWSATYSQVGYEKANWTYAFGNELTFGKFNMYADCYYSKEDVDTKSMLSAFAKRLNKNEFTALDTEYLGIAARFNFQVTPKWKVIVKGMYDTASSSKTNLNVEKGKYSNTYGYLGGFEYAPFEETKIRFFANYVGRKYEFTNLGKKAGFENYNTDRVSIGFIYKIPVF